MMESMISPAVARTTTNAKGVRAIKKHRIHPAEGQDIRALVLGALIEVKCTVCDNNPNFINGYVISHIA